jgi:O-antigen/teichoic acid export membrane protein
MADREAVENNLSRLDSATAAATLAHAEQAQALARDAVRARSGWTSWFLATFGVASVVFISLCALGGVIAYVASWVAYGVIAHWFARREHVSWRGFDRLSGRSFAAWFVLQGAVCGVGFNFFSGQLGYWVPLAFVAAAPFFVGAWYAVRR